MNPTVLCWHNAAVFAVIHLLKVCGINVPAENCEAGQETYMSHFSRWSRLTTSDHVNPWDALRLFAQEFTSDSVNDIRTKTQDSRQFQLATYTVFHVQSESAVSIDKILNPDERKLRKTNHGSLDVLSYASTA